jgi:hypothetical protein
VYEAVRRQRCLKGPRSAPGKGVLCTSVAIAVMVMDKLKSVVLSVAIATAVEAGALNQRATPTQPDWFKTSPDLYTG